ncbi:MAG TPA: hypothetical protein VLL95_06485, partial [Phnomibacter sp.]|nr:hypothetical protein [Phnomibacter sp.]
AGVDYEIKLNNGLYELLINETGAQALQKNMDWLPPIEYSKEELSFGEQVMKQAGIAFNGITGKPKPLGKPKPDPDGGSTDVGDVSYIVPQLSLEVVTAPKGAPWHSWVVVACGGMSIGHKGILYASKALGTTMVDLFENEQLRKDIRTEFEKRKGSEVWKAMLPDGPPPVN